MKRLLFFLACLATAATANAQRGSLTISYPIGFPMADLHDYVKQTSFRGISAEFNRRQRPNLDVGLEMGWNTFYEKENYKTYTEGTASISGTKYRYANIAPLIIGCKLYKTGANSSPYFGLGMGVLYVNRSTDFGLYRITKEAWPFCIRPEAGLTFKLQPGLSGLMGVKYYGAFKTDDMDGQSFLTVNLGVVFHR